MLFRSPTSAPRLVLLTTGTNGKVQIAYNPSADTNNGYYGDMQFGGRQRVVFFNNGNGMQPMFLGDDGSYNPNPPAVNGDAPVKSLEDTRFEAYDLNGKTVSKEAALKRLKAGGFVLISGDSRVPDASYLKQFRGDLLVLVSPELLNLPTGIKLKPGTPAIAAGAIAPAVRVMRAAPFAVPLKLQPVQELPVAPAPAVKPTPAAKK